MNELLRTKARTRHAHRAASRGGRTMLCAAATATNRVQPRGCQRITAAGAFSNAGAALSLQPPCCSLRCCTIRCGTTTEAPPRAALQGGAGLVDSLSR